ncbi:hypothetical protein CLV51_103513 [Chitinophaga niastensis]|uniref:AhpC/TSA family protein n=1 Tax=Chitinophaga niastensis TaxID=536980 RepID=A0A2P8HJY6_CHINA|nr:hypothetical protein [Chitinophaga niastensis]PSL46532.1 hypothetical protein CLV51_103513 [Chitinophaga niastensis]
MKYLIFASLMIAVITCSCKTKCAREDAKKLMGTWYEKKIQLSDNWTLINDSSVAADNRFDMHHPDSKFYVLHYFMADCDKCINELLKARDFIKNHKSSFPGTKYVFLASGPTPVYIKEAVDKSKFEYPVYYEKEYYAFKKSNGFPKFDNLYNTMLIDNQNKLLLFGFLYDNKKASDIYSGIINCN